MTRCCSSVLLGWLIASCIFEKSGFAVAGSRLSYLWRDSRASGASCVPECLLRSDFCLLAILMRSSWCLWKVHLDTFLLRYLRAKTAFLSTVMYYGVLCNMLWVAGNSGTHFWTQCKGGLRPFIVFWRMLWNTDTKRMFLQSCIKFTDPNTSKSSYLCDFIWLAERLSHLSLWHLKVALCISSCCEFDDESFSNAKAHFIRAHRIPWVYFRNPLQLKLCKLVIWSNLLILFEEEEKKIPRGTCSPPLPPSASFEMTTNSVTFVKEKL